MPDFETRSVAVCPDCRVHWYLDDAPAKCVDANHKHQRIEVHRHRSAVVLPDGAEITAVSFDAVDPYGRDRPPHYGLYLDPRWRPPWAHDHLDWPDFGLPEDEAHVLASITGLFDRARAGQRVEIGCLGGHGRTGTALACLVTLGGLLPDASVAWVRENYCAKAVETAEQEAFVLQFGRAATGAD
ncbi:MAG: protein-tyrosine phosphatase family protein [Acidimicrobiales bacterium]